MRNNGSTFDHKMHFLENEFIVCIFYSLQNSAQFDFFFIFKLKIDKGKYFNTTDKSVILT